MTLQSVSLDQVGVQTINGRKVPVFALPTGRYASPPDALGINSMISLDAAKMLKNGRYPLVHTITEAVVLDEVPLALRDADDQKRGAQLAIRALMDRLIDVKAPLNAVEN